MGKLYGGAFKSPCAADRTAIRIQLRGRQISSKLCTGTCFPIGNHVLEGVAKTSRIGRRTESLRKAARLALSGFQIKCNPRIKTRMTSIQDLASFSLHISTERGLSQDINIPVRTSCDVEHRRRAVSKYTRRATGSRVRNFRGHCFASDPCVGQAIKDLLIADSFELISILKHSGLAFHDSSISVITATILQAFQWVDAFIRLEMIYSR